MNIVSYELQAIDNKERTTPERQDSAEKTRWEKPKMEDVSEQVMAQPYIRFT